jgi:hypothetical protein
LPTKATGLECGMEAAADDVAAITSSQQVLQCLAMPVHAPGQPRGPAAAMPGALRPRLHAHIVEASALARIVLHHASQPPAGRGIPLVHPRHCCSLLPSGHAPRAHVTQRIHHHHAAQRSPFCPFAALAARMSCPWSTAASSCAQPFHSVWCRDAHHATDRTHTPDAHLVQHPSLWCWLAVQAAVGGSSGSPDGARRVRAREGRRALQNISNIQVSAVHAAGTMRGARRGGVSDARRRCRKAPLAA